MMRVFSSWIFSSWGKSNFKYSRLDFQHIQKKKKTVFFQPAHDGLPEMEA